MNDDRRIQTWFVRIMMSIVVIAQPFDVWTTNRMIESGKMTEANPFMIVAMHQLGSLYWLPKLGVALFIMVVLFRLKRSESRLSLWCSGLTACFYVTAILNNYYMWV